MESQPTTTSPGNSAMAVSALARARVETVVAASTL